MFGSWPNLIPALLSVGFLAPVLTPPHNPCAVLTAARFGKIMGYTATIDTTGSTATTCFYSGPDHAGGQFRILTETAGPQADAMLTRPGSSPPAGSGLVGGTYKEGTILFSISVRSSDKVKLQALVTEVRSNLK